LSLAVRFAADIVANIGVNLVAHIAASGFNFLFIQR
jgi:hypothetical protein